MTRRLCGTESNAFEKSKNIGSVGLDLFLEDAQSSKQHNNCDKVDLPSSKPNWFGLKTFRSCQKLTTQWLTIFSLTLHATGVSEF